MTFIDDHHRARDFITLTRLCFTGYAQFGPFHRLCHWFPGHGTHQESALLAVIIDLREETGISPRIGRFSKTLYCSRLLNTAPHQHDAQMVFDIGSIGPSSFSSPSRVRLSLVPMIVYTDAPGLLVPSMFAGKSARSGRSITPTRLLTEKDNLYSSRAFRCQQCLCHPSRHFQAYMREASAYTVISDARRNNQPMLEMPKTRYTPGC